MVLYTKSKEGSLGTLNLDGTRRLANLNNFSQLLNAVQRYPGLHWRILLLVPFHFRCFWSLNKPFLSTPLQMWWRWRGCLAPFSSLLHPFLDRLGLSLLECDNLFGTQEKAGVERSGDLFQEGVSKLLE